MEKIYSALTISKENLENLTHAYMFGFYIIEELDREITKLGYDLVKFDNIEISREIELNEVNILILKKITDEFQKRKNLAVLNPKYREIKEFYDL